MTNILGAFATTLNDAIGESIDAAELPSRNAAAALIAIHNHPGENIDVLRRVLKLTHSGVVRLINTLEVTGLVERQPSQQDGRVVVLCLTSQGSNHVKKILSARTDMINRIIENLTNEQRQTLLPILETMLGTLTHNHDSARRNCRFCNEEACHKEGCPVEMAIQD